MLLAIDPGNEQSAFVLYDGEKPIFFGKWENRTLLRSIQYETCFSCVSRFAIETLKPRGMPTSFEEMQTQLWAGRFYQVAWEILGGDKFAIDDPMQVFRIEVKKFHCGRVTANDSNIRQAIIDRYGGKAAAIGKKKTPGPLYGVSKDVWSALAIAIYAHESFNREGAEPCKSN